MIDPDVLCRDADRAHELGEHDRAVRLYHHALRTLKSCGVPRPTMRLSRIYARVASCERAMGRANDAVDALEQCVLWDDSYADGWFLLGETCVEALQFVRAEEAFIKFCDRCDSSEVERGRAKLRLLRSRGSDKWHRRENAQPRRHEEVLEPREEVPELREQRSEEESNFYAMVNELFCALWGFICSFASFSIAGFRQAGRLHKLPRDIQQDSLALLTCVLFAIMFTQPACTRVRNLRRSSSECDKLCIEFQVPSALRTEMCETWDHGHWFPVVVVAANLLTHTFIKNPAWSVGPVHAVNRNRLILYQFVHVNETHLFGNMLTLLAISTEVSMALGCDQILFALVYLCSGWFGGLCAALVGVSNSRHVGASGSISGAILALSVLRPHQAVRILGDVKASQPWLLLIGTLAADISSDRRVSWEAHLGGGLAGAVLASAYRLIIRI